MTSTQTFKRTNAKRKLIITFSKIAHTKKTLSFFTNSTIVSKNTFIFGTAFLSDVATISHNHHRYQIKRT